MRRALLTSLAILACDDGGGGVRRDLGPADATPDTTVLDGGPPSGACSPTSIARAPWNGQATGGSPDALRPTFRWATAQGATRYELQVDDSCGADVRACAFPSPEVDESTTETSFAPSSDLAVSTIAPIGRRYFWRVRSCDDSECDDWSEPRYLDVGRSAKDFDGDGFADAVVGARSRDNPESNEGNVFVYRGSAGGLPSLPDDTLDNPQNQDGAGFGYSVATADVNGDGFSDLIVGAPSQENGASNEGAAFVFHGSAAGLPDTPDTTLDNPDNESLAFFGSAVASAGDLDGDGFSDIVVGASGRQGGGGGAFVYLGSATGIDEQPSITLDPPGGVAGTGLGVAVGTAGDTGGDGYVDLLVGASGDDPKNPGGAVFVYCASDAGVGIEPSATLRPSSGNENAAFGTSLAGGDMNLDGLADIAVGAPQDLGSGSVSVFLGNPSGLPQLPASTLDGPGGRFGVALAAGDLTGDGRTDLVVGADEFTSGAPLAGAAFVHAGTDTGVALAPSPGLDNPANETNGHFGASVAALGDVDGDGDNELIVGAPQQAGTGQAFVYYGDGGGIGSIPDATLNEPAGESGAKFGYSVAALAAPFAPDATRIRLRHLPSLGSPLGRL